MWRRFKPACFIAILVIILLAWGCQAAPSPSPSPTPTPPPTGVIVTPGSALGTLSGTVTNSLTNAPIPGATITTNPVVQGVTITTKSDGTYSADLPVGNYTITFKKDNFTPVTQNLSLVAGKIIRDVALKPVSPVAIDLGKPLTATSGSSVSIKATVQPLDGSTVKSYEWTQVDGVEARMDDAASDTVKIALGTAADYKARLVAAMVQLDRFQVQPVNPHVLEVSEAATFKVTVTTSSGKYSQTQTVSVNLPYAVSGGIADVPIRVPVLLHGKDQASYNWTMSAPAGSKATLDSTTDQNPSFTPDVTGKYTITETASGATINVYAGIWKGAITGVDASGKPVTTQCSICHNGTIAPDQFKDWRNTGHAAIFTKNLNTGTHYGEDCFSCHTVGFDTSAANNGFDDAPDYESFPSSGLLNNPSPDNWSNMLSRFPMAAQLANIQCENCHGPNDNTGLHGNGKIDPARISLAADLCAGCHGEPLRHGRFQQWEESKHADYGLAIEEATVENRGATAGSCGRCHSGQGFLAWINQADLTKNIQGATGNATVDELKALGLTTDMVHPQTCAVCHDPHAEGASSGAMNTATVRVQNDTPLLPAGFAAMGVGKGAVCITCHNTRNGLHNDDNPPTGYTAPHSPAQGDILMGQNAYFVTPGQRSPHSFLTNTCATCHMEATPPPPEFSFEGTGTNHSFEASPDICADCHSKDFRGADFRAANQERIRGVADKLGLSLLGRIPSSLAVKDYTPHQYGGKSYDIKSDSLVLSKTSIVSAAPVEIHGQQGFILQLKSPVPVTYSPPGETPYTLSVSQVQVQFGDFTTDGKTAVVPATDPLVKATWNYFLLHGDGSGGIHNPEYVNFIIDATLQALK